VTAPILKPLPLCLLAVALWGLIGLAGLLRPRSHRLAGALYPLGAACALLLAAAAARALALPLAPERAVLPVGLPDLPVHLRLDALAAGFLVLLGAAAAGISVFAAGYFGPHAPPGAASGAARAPQGTPPGLLCLQYHLFLASMALVFLADDAYAFMLAWEVMALSSYFLVTAEHGSASIRAAGFLYLLMAHVGALSILLAFGVMQGGTWRFTFDAMRGAHLAAWPASVAFLLALAGFGAKAGLVPLHVWLPEAHPAAPSPVSALMSGVMLKTAVYGMLRVSFDLLQASTWWWGLVPLTLGLLSALYGVVFAAVQTDMKRLLAWSSIENIGIIFTALGLALVFRGAGLPAAAALALVALLYHCLNHACMKSLVFLGTGAVLHATGERSLARLGGLIHRMPQVAWLTLVGALALAGLPPLNGFVSEWLLLQSFLFAHSVPHTFVNMLLPLGAGLIALAAALAAYVMVKFFGVVFLGRPRDAVAAQAHEAGPAERLGLAWLAALCLVLGVLPSAVIGVLDLIVHQLAGVALQGSQSRWWLLAPVPGRAASYSAVVMLAALAGVTLLTVLATRTAARPVRRARAWACGGTEPTARMQDTAEGFGQPIRHLFSDFFSITVEAPGPSDREPRYRVHVADRLWERLYLPAGSAVQRAADRLAFLQQGRIAAYLLYSFLTLVMLLALVL